ncbi:MAG TPA: polysaccharide biosynthesis/export family protein [Vicinamibacterales bacterium]|jgi:polysaccharide export outer membrane protein|nr:polysaccharide biosynthesis/export family protein [Vicinamibacterales bacterium]
MDPSLRLRRVITTAVLMVVSVCALAAQEAGGQATTFDYVVGPLDVLMITSYDQADLSGKFSVESDGTFTFPLIGRFRAGGLTLRQVEDALKQRLSSEGYFKNPQITVSVEQYKSQKIFIVGEVRSPGTYPLSGGMSFVEALARAGSTTPSASGEAIIVHANDKSMAAPVRVNLKDLQNGVLSENVALRDGDTIFIPRAESVYVFGQVRTPGAYSLQQKNTTVLQALSLAGGVTDRGAINRVRIVRMVKSQKKEFRVKLDDLVQPGDTVIVDERYF